MITISIMNNVFLGPIQATVITGSTVRTGTMAGPVKIPA